MRKNEIEMLLLGKPVTAREMKLVPFEIFIQILFLVWSDWVSDLRGDEQT